MAWLVLLIHAPCPGTGHSNPVLHNIWNRQYLIWHLKLPLEPNQSLTPLISSQQSSVLYRYLSCLGCWMEDLWFDCQQWKEFYLLQNIRVVPGAHTDSHLLVTRSFFQGEKTIGDVTLTANPHPVQSWRMSGGTPPFHQSIRSFIYHSTTNNLYSC